MPTTSSSLTRSSSRGRTSLPTPLYAPFPSEGPRPAPPTSTASEQRIARTVLADNAQLTPEGWRMLLATARDISSDFDAATLLTELVPHLPRDASGRRALRATGAQ